jgi:predicted  nucleic acid-binding Zn-ribbon protein
MASALLRLQKGKLEAQRLGTGADQALLTEVDDLRTELNQVRTELAEVQERLDFTERLLASGDRSQRTT